MKTGFMGGMLRAWWETQQDSMYKNLDSLSDEYKKDKEAMESKFKELANSVTMEQKKKLSDYCEARMNTEVSANYIFYSQGFCDGVKAIIDILKK